VESFNISVAAALILYEAQQQRLRRLGSSGDLDERQQQRLLAEFLLRSVVRAGGCSWCVGGGGGKG
jgi:tRNA (guanosine-2'-O-)-methyltransferase